MGTGITICLNFSYFYPVVSFLSAFPFLSEEPCDIGKLHDRQAMELRSPCCSLSILSNHYIRGVPLIHILANQGGPHRCKMGSQPSSFEKQSVLSILPSSKRSINERCSHHSTEPVVTGEWRELRLLPTPNTFSGASSVVVEAMFDSSPKGVLSLTTWLLHQICCRTSCGFQTIYIYCILHPLLHTTFHPTVLIYFVYFYPILLAR